MALAICFCALAIVCLLRSAASAIEAVSFWRFRVFILLCSAVGADGVAVAANVGFGVGDCDSNSKDLIQLFILIHRLVTGRSASLIDPIAGAVFDTTPFTLFLKSTS